MIYKKKAYPREYRIWKAMRARCAAPSYKNLRYQVKGIKVCERWNSFSLFMEDMGPSNIKLSLDRINNDGDYIPENCRWATQAIQNTNKSVNIFFTYNNETKTLKEWAKELNIKYTTLYLRIFRSKLSFEQAIMPDPFKRLILFNGKSQTLKEWAKEFNLKYSTLVNRVHDGWTPLEAIQVPTSSSNKKYIRYSPILHENAGN